MPKRAKKPTQTATLRLMVLIWKRSLISVPKKSKYSHFIAICRWIFHDPQFDFINDFDFINNFDFDFASKFQNDFDFDLINDFDFALFSKMISILIS